MAPTATAASKKSEKKGGAPTSSDANKRVKKHPLFEKTPRNFTIGNDIQPKRDLSRFVRWPANVLIQRKKRVLMQRLKVPPHLNAFSFAIDKSQATQMFRLLNKYRPETSVEKKKRLVEEAEKRAASGSSSTDANKKVHMIKYGLNHVTDLIEAKKARLVMIAHDVEPVELVCWMPELCRQMNVPFCIVKGKARLGALVHKKTAAVLCIDSVKKEDQAELDQLCKNFSAQFNDNRDLRRKWGGGIMRKD